MSSVDIVAFIEARLAEDEHDAKGCQFPEWELDGSIVPKGGSGWDQVVDWVYDDDGTTWEHIVRHDPARVLREVEAKRRLLARFLDAQKWYTANRAAPAGEVDGLWNALRLLAEVWDAHPDYQANWAPG